MAPPPFDATPTPVPDRLLQALVGVARSETPEAARTQAEALLAEAPDPGSLRPLLDALVTRAEEHEALRQLAKTDPLTGIANRRGFDEALARECARAARAETPLAVLLLDLDGLKELNDGLGHDAGDEAIRSVAQVCHAAVRRSDLVARIGGDELAILLPDSGGVQARRVALRIQERVADVRVGGRPLGVSVGVAAGRGRAAEPEQLLRRADAMLYEDKRRRRRARQAAGSATTYAFQQSSFSTDSRWTNSPLPSPSSPLSSQ